MTPTVIEKLSSKCDQDCQVKKNQTLQNLEDAKKEIDKKLTDAESAKKLELGNLKKASQVFGSIANLTNSIEAFRNDPENYKRNLKKKIKAAKKLLSQASGEKFMDLVIHVSCTYSLAHCTTNLTKLNIEKYQDAKFEN